MIVPDQCDKCELFNCQADEGVTEDGEEQWEEGQEEEGEPEHYEHHEETPLPPIQGNQQSASFLYYDLIYCTTTLYIGFCGRLGGGLGGPKHGASSWNPWGRAQDLSLFLPPRSNNGRRR